MFKGFVKIEDTCDLSNSGLTPSISDIGDIAFDMFSTSATVYDAGESTMVDKNEFITFFKLSLTSVLSFKGLKSFSISSCNNLASYFIGV